MHYLSPTMSHQITKHHVGYRITPSNSFVIPSHHAFATVANATPTEIERAMPHSQTLDELIESVQQTTATPETQGVKKFIIDTNTPTMSSRHDTVSPTYHFEVPSRRHHLIAGPHNVSISNADDLATREATCGCSYVEATQNKGIFLTKSDDEYIRAFYGDDAITTLTTQDQLHLHDIHVEQALTHLEHRTGKAYPRAFDIPLEAAVDAAHRYYVQGDNLATIDQALLNHTTAALENLVTTRQAFPQFLKKSRTTSPFTRTAIYGIDHYLRQSGFTFNGFNEATTKWHDESRTATLLTYRRDTTIEQIALLDNHDMPYQVEHGTIKQIIPDMHERIRKVRTAIDTDGKSLNDRINSIRELLHGEGPRAYVDAYVNDDMRISAIINGLGRERYLARHNRSHNRLDRLTLYDFEYEAERIRDHNAQTGDNVELTVYASR